MQKEDFISLLIYFIMGAVVIMVGLIVFRPAMEAGYLFNSASENFVFLLVSLIVAVITNVLLLEFGHLIGAKLGRYTVLSFNIFGFCFYKTKTEEGKIKTKFKMRKFNGLGGQTIIAPKSEKSNPMPFVFTPLVLLLMSFVALYFAFFFIKSVTDDAKVMLMAIKYGVVVLASIGACFIIYNYFPAKLDSLNDGYRLMLLNKKINIEAYNYKLQNEEIEYYGGTVEEVRTFEEITDFTANVNFEAAIQEIIKKDFEKAQEIISKTTENRKKMANSTYRRFALLKVFLAYLMQSEEEATAYYKDNVATTELSDDARNCKNYDGLRVYIAYVGISEKSINEIKFALEKKKKLDKREDPGEVEKQNAIINIILDKIEESNPGAAELKL